MQSDASKLAAGTAKPNNKKTHECFFSNPAKNWQSQVSQEFDKNIAWTQSHMFVAAEVIEVII